MMKEMTSFIRVCISQLVLGALVKSYPIDAEFKPHLSTFFDNIKNELDEETKNLLVNEKISILKIN